MLAPRCCVVSELAKVQRPNLASPITWSDFSNLAPSGWFPTSLHWSLLSVIGYQCIELLMKRAQCPVVSDPPGRCHSPLWCFSLWWWPIGRSTPRGWIRLLIRSASLTFLAKCQPSQTMPYSVPTSMCPQSNDVGHVKIMISSKLVVCASNRMTLATSKSWFLPTSQLCPRRKSLAVITSNTEHLRH